MDQQTTKQNFETGFSSAFVRHWNENFRSLFENLRRKDKMQENIWTLGIKVMSFFSRSESMMLSKEDDNKIKELATKVTTENYFHRMVRSVKESKPVFNAVLFERDLKEIVHFIESIESKQQSKNSSRVRKTSF